MNKYFILMLSLYLLPYLFYRSVSHGLGHKAEYLQLRRFLPCAILAVLPAYLANISLFSPIFITSFVTGLSWIITYPLFYFFTYRKNSSDFGFHFDIVFGLYIIAWLTSLKILVITFNLLPFIFLPFITTLEFLIFLIPVAQWIYYYLYHSCVTEDGMIMIQETNYNEIVEFFKQFSFIFNLLIFSLLFFLFAIFITVNLSFSPIHLSLLNSSIIFAVTIFLTYYLWKNGENEKSKAFL